MQHLYKTKTEVLNTANAKGYLLASTQHNDIVELEVGPSGEVPEHALPVDVTFYVLAGRGQLAVANKTYLATRGDVLEVKKELGRAWLNPHTEALKLLVIKQKSS